MPPSRLRRALHVLLRSPVEPIADAAAEPAIVGPDVPVDREGLDNHGLVLLMAAHLDADSTFIDIGANEGRFLYAAYDLAPDGAHIAFEPLPEMAGLVRERFPSATVYNVALADESGRTEFIRVLEDSGYSGLLARPYPGDYRTERIEVDLARLDDLVGPDVMPAFVKVDVEGAEYKVLRGGIETLRRARPWIVFEHGLHSAEAHGSSPFDVWDLLSTELDFKIYDLDGQGPLGRDQFDHVVRVGARWNFLARP